MIFFLSLLLFLLFETILLGSTRAVSIDYWTTQIEGPENTLDWVAQIRFLMHNLAALIPGGKPKPFTGYAWH